MKYLLVRVYPFLLFVLLVVSKGMTQSIPVYLPSNGLVGWWPFNGNANDESANQLNLSNVSTPTLTNDRFGHSESAYSFNGTTNGLRAQDNEMFNLVNAATISGWFKANQMIDYQTIVIREGDDGFGSTQWIVRLVGSKLSLWLREDNGAFHEYYSTQDISVNFWYFFSISWDTNSSKIVFFINGIEDSQHDFNYSINSYITNTFRIGFSSDLSQSFQGTIDDVSVFSRAFNVQEFYTLYSGTSSETNNAAVNIPSVPLGINYQASCRDSQGNAMTNQNLQVRFTLIMDSISGFVEYVELHNLMTNNLGLFTTTFGKGMAEIGSFVEINWVSGQKYLKVEIDVGDGFVFLGTQQLLSVPYALRSNSSAKSETIVNAFLPVFSGNAAALSGGMQVGQMYRTSNGDLKIVY